jgi:hypothetical protein
MRRTRPNSLAIARSLSSPAKPLKIHSWAPGAMAPSTVGPRISPPAISPMTRGILSRANMLPTKWAMPMRATMAAKKRVISTSVREIAARGRSGMERPRQWGI